jgi:uncharacterized delta-60 repeat protein
VAGGAARARVRRHATLLFLAVVTGVGCARAAHAAGLELDPTFADGGALRVRGQNAHDVAIQSTGRLVVLTEDASGLGVLGLRTDGTIDEGFAESGLAAIPDSRHAFTRLVPPVAIAVAPDDRIVVAWLTFDGTIGVARLLDDGAPDGSFGIDGSTTIVLPRSACSPASCRQLQMPLTVDAQGRILLAAAVSTGTTGGSVALLRLDEHGQLDPGFGTNGEVVTAVPGGGLTDVPDGIVVGDHGRIVIAASRLDEFGGATGIVLAGLTGDGLPDPTFANRGRPFVALAGLAHAAALARDPLGRLVVAGTFRRAPGRLADIVVLRRLSNGAPDGAFGGRGIALAGKDVGSGADEVFARSLVVTRDAQVVVYGAWRPLVGSPCLHVPTPFLTAFASDGAPRDDAQPSPIGVAGGAALQADGKIVLAGNGPSLCSDPEPRFVVSRLLPLPSSTGGTPPVQIRPRGGTSLPRTRLVR